MQKMLPPVLIPTKLGCPQRLHQALLRERLLVELENANDHGLVLVHAPAGYGKTTLVAQWAAGQEHLGWLSLDEGDNRPERFAAYLVAALQQATHDRCPASESLVQAGDGLEAIVSQLLAELSVWRGAAILVLDDYQCIDNPAIHQALRFLLRHQPENFTLVLVSRGLPPLGIANIRVQGRLLELDCRALAFDHQETRYFLQSRLGQSVDVQESALLCDRVEGWVTALQLASLGNRGKQTAERQPLQLDLAHLWDYLQEEVLASVADGDRLLLLRCALLHSMNDDLIAAVTGLDDGGAQLEQLMRQGHFIRRLDQQPGWYDFHPLFAQFLRHSCQRELGASLPELHGHAARGWLALGRPAEAVHHALAAGDAAALQAILLQHAWPLFHQGELSLLTACLQALPQSELQQMPNLILLQAWLTQSLQYYGQVDQRLELAEQEVLHQQSLLDPAQQAEFMALRAQVALSADHPVKARHLAQAALQHLTDSSPYGRIVATSVLGEVHHCLGELTPALTMMQRTEQKARHQGTHHYVLWALLQQSEILIAQGYLQAAYELQEQAFDLVRTQHLELVPMHEFLLRLRAQVLWCWGRLDEAQNCARRGLQVLASYEPAQQMQCLVMLARCSLARGDLDNADSHLQRAEALLQHGQYHSDWISNINGTRLLYWQMSDKPDEVRKWLQRAVSPEHCNNHFQQRQWRNLARAHLLLGEFAAARDILTRLTETARRLQLVSDLNRNLLLNAVLAWHDRCLAEAEQNLLEALSLANRTGFIAPFVVEGEVMMRMLRKLLEKGRLTELEQHRAQRIVKDINRRHRQQVVHFDEVFVERLLHHPQVPELIRTSPLTQREWQVLGLIYSGYSNEQIAGELAVATTTVKTHIRNLYQKLGLTHRQEAVQRVETMLQLIGYNPQRR